MARPIPVIAFAIAAYAAYARRESPADEAPDLGLLFGRLWRNLPRGSAEAIVKIGVIADADSARGPLKAAEHGEEVWLRHVEETAEGFSGVIALAPGRMRAAIGASRIAFGLSHIRGWRLRADGGVTRRKISAPEREAGAEG